MFGTSWNQLFEILLTLLERPGQLVPRAELQRRIRTDGTFVDFDKSLNKAVNKLRAALNDSANCPRFIETLPGRGYRFVAESQGVDSPAVSPAAPLPRPRWYRAVAAVALITTIMWLGGLVTTSLLCVACRRP